MEPIQLEKKEKKVTTEDSLPVSSLMFEVCIGPLMCLLTHDLNGPQMSN